MPDFHEAVPVIKAQCRTIFGKAPQVQLWLAPLYVIDKHGADAAPGLVRLKVKLLDPTWRFGDKAQNLSVRYRQRDAPVV